MSRITYVHKNFRADALDIIRKANQICENYREQGYDLTLRQLYYQFVSRDWIANRDSEYKRLGSIINDARLAGLLDWDYIVDRTRNLKSVGHWDTPADIIESAARSFAMDKWSSQRHRVEVWIEKDALVGVLQSCCPALDVPFFSCRGYTSQSEIWNASQRLGGYIAGGQKVTIIHLGDHDPSGIDMTRDIEERLNLFIGVDAAYAAMEVCLPETSNANRVATGKQAAYEATEQFHVDRIALNMDQIDEYNPPPNPAKLTDARARGYIERFGDSSWELDALEPSVLVELIEEAVAQYRDDDEWDFAVEEEDSERKVLTDAAKRWEEVKEFLS